MILTFIPLALFFDIQYISMYFVGWGALAYQSNFTFSPLVVVLLLISETKSSCSFFIHWNKIPLQPETILKPFKSCKICCRSSHEQIVLTTSRKLTAIVRFLVLICWQQLGKISLFFDNPWAPPHIFCLLSCGPVFCLQVHPWWRPGARNVLRWRFQSFLFVFICFWC